MTNALLITAVAIIIALTITAIYYQVQLSKQTRKVAAAQSEQKTARAKKVAQTKSDLAFLARAFIDNQVELNEVSLRIHHLLNVLSFEGPQRKNYEVFDIIANQIKDVPTHSNWNSLDKKTRRNYETMFKNIEEKYRTEAKDAAHQLTENELQKLLH